MHELQEKSLNNALEHYDVSVIIPVHNTVKYLPSLFYSLAMQHAENIKIEFIFVCDKCNDGSYFYIENNNDMLPFDGFQLYEVDFGNAGASRNYGLNKASGDWIWFIDSDDYLINDESFNIMMQCAGKYPIANILNMDFIFEYKVATIKSNNGRMWPACWSRWIKKDYIGDIRFDENKTIGEDMDFMNRLLSRNECSICDTKQLIYHYRYNREGSLTSTNGK